MFPQLLFRIIDQREQKQRNKFDMLITPKQDNAIKKHHKI